MGIGDRWQRAAAMSGEVEVEERHFLKGQMAVVVRFIEMAACRYVEGIVVVAVTGITSYAIGVGSRTFHRVEAKGYQLVEAVVLHHDVRCTVGPLETAEDATIGILPITGFQQIFCSVTSFSVVAIVGDIEGVGVSACEVPQIGEVCTVIFSVCPRVVWTVLSCLVVIVVVGGSFTNSYLIPLVA